MVEILKAKPEDARDIHNLLKKTWLDTYPNEEIGISEKDIEDFITARFTEDSIEKRKNAIEESLDRKDKIFLVAKENGVLLGQCHGIDNGSHYQLKALYVLPEHQRKGIGMLLWEKLKDFFVEDKDIVVWVASYNQKAINFYEKIGFIKIDKDSIKQNYEILEGKYIPEIEMVIKGK